MAPTYDRMVAQQEARERQHQDEATAAFRAKNEGQFIAAYEELGRIQQEEAEKRRTAVVDDLSKRMWKGLAGLLGVTDRSRHPLFCTLAIASTSPSTGCGW